MDGVIRIRPLLLGWLLALSAQSAVAEPPGGVFTEKDEIYDLIENCQTSRSREALRPESGPPLTVTCRNKCMEAKLNAWLAQDPANEQRYFGARDIYDIERAAGLSTCREGFAMVERSRCLGQDAPDILAKVGPIPCGKTVLCEVRFNIDERGNPAAMEATCQPGPAKAEYEREALCLTGSMSFPSHRGRKNVVQPFEMKSDQACPIS